MLNNQKGFTLIEMLIVLLIISVLLIITIPNVVKYNTLVEDKGCEAFEDMVQSEVQLYKIEKGVYPTTITDIEGIDTSTKNSCTDWTDITIGTDGVVSIGSSGS
ncbi:prepilin-type N-terminal cleavage/methylation domain-containing protein [Filobacillus milosensis]|uniref:ComG operon protein 3 n=1 Tax=Filobacillus milosensis TaxID=94137 RepID=A0A4Y8ISB9_9BACI|nr:competence type IV pilus major pilin ComGC [Filobacillus milosensis]TFB23813.1 prepilin-type N-terminal cleavage/methylation domain-containing protein [Filobacillus milosensis]